MRYQFLGQILFALIAGGMLLGVPAAAVFYGWREWRDNIRQGGLPVWRRVTASVAIITITAQMVLFVSIIAAIVRYRVLDHYGVILFRCVFIDLGFGLFAGSCTLAWRGRAKWWLFVSSFYLPAISFFTVLAVLAY